MSFSDAIRDAFSKYATFRGRSSRAAYWWFYLFGAIVVLAALILDAVARTGGVIYVLAVLGLFLPNLAISVRRLHDADHSGWWMFIAIVPLIGFVVLLVFTLQGSKPPNEWGEGPDDRARDAPAWA